EIKMPPDNKEIFVISNVGLHAELDKVDSGTKKTSFEDALKLSGFGNVQIIVLLVCGLILMAVINETMGMAIIIPAAQCDLALSSTRKGVISAVSFIACGWIILPMSWSIQITDEFFYRPWRLLLIINALPGFIGAIWLYYLPESGKYLLSQGNDTEALNILKWVYKTNNRGKDKEFPVQYLLSEFDKEHYQKVHMNDGRFAFIVSFWEQTVPLLKKPIRSAGMGLWFPHIQNQISFKNETVDQTVCQILEEGFRFTRFDLTTNLGCDDTVNTKAFVDSITLGAFYVVGYVVYALFIKSLGRGAILITSLFGSGISGLALQWTTQPIAIVIFFCTHIVLSGICVSVTNGAVVDIIPTHFRGMAVCIVLMFGRLGSIVGSNIIGAILEDVP
ncbi:Synaptic vesicle glycoprotein 2B, partial [Pseudolycoriella hygida]